MFKSFLVPLDGSKLAEVALPVADYLARCFGAKVTLLHTIERNAPSQVHGDAHLTNEAEANAYLHAIAQRSFAPGVIVDIHVHTSEVSDVARSITAHADEFGNDLIVMCAHGRGGVQGWMVGTIAQQVVAAGHQPVLLVPAESPAKPNFSCTQILVSLDVDPEHAQALSPALELAQACHTTLHLVIVVPTPQTLTAAEISVGRLLPLTTSAILEMTEQNAADYLKSQVEHVQRQNVSATGAIYRGSPAAVVVQVAEQKHADIIVLATHGRTGLDAFFEESVAAKISNRSHIPLLLIRIQKAPD